MKMTQEGTEELQLPSADTEHEKMAVVDTSEREAVKVEVTQRRSRRAAAIAARDSISLA